MSIKVKTMIIWTVLLLLLAAAPKTQAADNQIAIDTYESDTELTAVISANNLTEPVIGIAFDLAYDPEVLSYSSYEEGAFFESGGEPIYLVTYDINHLGGRVIAGITLKRADQEVNATGTIIAFNFDIIEKVDTELVFKNPIISKINDEGKREDLQNIEWIDQTVYMEEEKDIILATEDSLIEPLQPIETETQEEDEPPNTMMANVLNIPRTHTTITIIVISILSMLLAICYIAWRKPLIRRNAVKTTHSRIEKSS